MNQASADLAKEMAAAQKKEFPNAQVATFPSAYFLQDVYVYKGDPEGNEVGSTRTAVNPRYCATNPGAAQVSAVLGGAAETRFLNPMNPDGLLDGWRASQNVPYLVFERGGVKGKPINAGFLLDYWTHGVNGDLALQNAQKEVEGSF